MPKTKKFYENPEEYRKYVNRNRKSNYRRGDFKEDLIRHIYTLDEINEILEHKITDRELAKKYKLSVQSVQIKRCRLKKQLEEHKNERS